MQWIQGESYRGEEAVLRFVLPGVQVSFGDEALQKAYRAQYAGDELTLKEGETRELRLKTGEGFADVIVTAVRADKKWGLDAFRRAVEAAGGRIRALGSRTVFIDSIELGPDPKELLRQTAMTLPLCFYRFDRYRSDREPPRDIRAACRDKVGAEAIREGISLSGAVAEARDLVNDIAEHMTPERLAARAAELGAEHGFSVEVLEEKEISALGMNLLLAVSRGSALPPRLIVMRWNGAGDETGPIGLIGKGITYDSGGLHIKTSGMESMNYDMNGGAAVIGAMCAIADSRLRVNVIAVVAASENMVDARSYRNGDILRSMSGRTVYVRNTDAEGRLTMADSITYCLKTANPTEMIEVAGLTGAVCNFYGNVCAAAFTHTPAFYRRIASLMEVSGEKVAEMPDFPEYADLLKWKFADLNNAPEGPCAGITAALFLAAFAENTPFLHIDFGAMPFTKKDGANGFGVKLLYEYAKARAGNEGLFSGPPGEE